MSPELETPLRSLPHALAHCFANTYPGADRLLVLNRIFAGLSPARQLMCRYELHETRAAMRGERLAEVRDK